MTQSDVSAYWRAVALLRLDRPAGLRGLEGCFRSGSAPHGLDGPLRGRFLATTVGLGLDRGFEWLARAWMPWQGKVFDHADQEGRNLFTAATGRVIRVTLPRYDALRDEDGGRCSAFAFHTSVGAGALDRDVSVLRIDYRDVPENPSWPVRRILDELVTVADGLYLGQALMWWRGGMRRVAWFALESGSSG